VKGVYNTQSLPTLPALLELRLCILYLPYSYLAV